MGPKTSPLKRASEDTEGAGMENKKKRRKKLKHELIGEGWGELPKYQGAEEGREQAPTPLHPQTREQELEAEEQAPPTPPGEQGSPTRHIGSQVTREQHRRQARISEFLSPTSRVWRGSARPAVDQEVSHMGDQSATRISSRGSPRRDITVGIPDVGDRNKPFEGQTDVQIESSYDAPIVEEHTDRECDDVPDDAVGCRFPVEKVTKSMGAPSSGENTKLTGSGRKQIEGNVSDEFEGVCEFKRGGMFVTHRSMGAKYVEHWKE